MGLQARAPALAALAVLATVVPAPGAAARDASRPPVVLIVFDEFPTDSLVGADGKIDPVRYPGFAALAGTSTWFRNHHAVADTTHSSVPSILTSTPPRTHQRFRITHQSYRHSVFTLLGSAGYRISHTDGDTRICPPRYCAFRKRFKLGKITSVRSRLRKVHRVLASLRRRKRPRLTYFHSILPHVPWHLTPSGHLRDPGPPGKDARLLGGIFGFFDPFLVLQDEQRHLLQVGYVDRVVAALMDRLKRQGLFDRALVVITADHGVSFRLGITNRRAVRRDGQNVEEIALVPLFVKRPGQRHGRTSSAWVRGTDVLPTIADVLGLRPGGRPVGVSAYSRAAAARRSLVTSSPDVGYTVRMRGSAVERQRRVNVARRHGLFGTGDWERVFAIGPNQELLGRRPEELPSAPAGGLVADYDLPADLSNVNLGALFLPSWAVGALRGRDSGPGVRRDLALAVNGTIRAVGRSVHIHRLPDRENFTLIFDERHLNNGRNTIQLYEVQHVGQQLALAPLGGR